MYVTCLELKNLVTWLSYLQVVWRASPSSFVRARREEGLAHQTRLSHTHPPHLTFLIPPVLLEGNVSEVKYGGDYSKDVSLLLTGQTHVVHRLLKDFELISVVYGRVSERGWVQILRIEERVKISYFL